jgi:tetratricopeptide (TPR) repeat protein
MKRFWTFISCCLLSVYAIAQNENALFDKANSAYTNNNFSSAIELYDSLVVLDYSSSALFYNLGNAYYKNGQLASAILNYERALRLDPYDEDIINNLGIAREKTIDRFETLPKPIIQNLSNGTVKLFTPSGWGIVSLLLFTMLGIGLFIYFFTPIRRPGFIIAVIGFVLGFFSLFMAYSHSSYLSNHIPAIIMSPSSYVKSAPSKSAEDVFILHEGTKAEILDELEGWKKIRLIDGKIGWIPKLDLSEI